MRVKAEEQILAAIDRVFGGVAKPEHFTDWKHCEECAEHDALLRLRDRTTLKIEDVGNPGWDPLCFSSAQGLAYYMPALARFALSEALFQGEGYAGQLTFHLGPHGSGSRLARFCNPEQRAAVAALLSHLTDAGGIAATDVEEIGEARELWMRGI